MRGDGSTTRLDVVGSGETALCVRVRGAPFVAKRLQALFNDAAERDAYCDQWRAWLTALAACGVDCVPTDLWLLRVGGGADGGERVVALLVQPLMPKRALLDARLAAATSARERSRLLALVLRAVTRALATPDVGIDAAVGNFAVDDDGDDGAERVLLLDLSSPLIRQRGRVRWRTSIYFNSLHVSLCGVCWMDGCVLV